MNRLHQPLALGELTLPNRIVMAPMTRSRADSLGVLPEMAIEYYVQRATAGLQITEATQTSPMGQGYARTPGMHNAAQAAAWSEITSAVHRAGGRIFQQLFHVGRIAHSANRTITDPPVAPSAIRAQGNMWTDAHGMQPFDEPVALSPAGIRAVIQEFADATRLAVAAGFDGVELHAASGYLHMQFLTPGVNQRDDEYGGTTAKRSRFVVETLEAMIAAAGSARKVGIKISPAMPFNDCFDPDPGQTYQDLVTRLSPMGLAYLHVMRSSGYDVAPLRPLFNGPFLLGGGFESASAEAALVAGEADAIVFGKPYVSNPDLPARIAQNAPWAESNPATYYSPGAAGYIDYPPLS